MDSAEVNGNGTRRISNAGCTCSSVVQMAVAVVLALIKNFQKFHFFSLLLKINCTRKTNLFIYLFIYYDSSINLYFNRPVFCYIVPFAAW
jgi:hypothetical protein